MELLGSSRWSSRCCSSSSIHSPQPSPAPAPAPALASATSASRTRHCHPRPTYKHTSACSHAEAPSTSPPLPLPLPTTPSSPPRPYSSATYTTEAPAPTPSTSARSGAAAKPELRFRRCTLEDVPAVAAICGQAFGFGNFPGIDVASLNQLEERYAVTIEREVTQQLTQALLKKGEAKAEHRTYRLQRQYQFMQAQLASLRGMRAVYPGPESPQDLRAVQRWQRARMFMCVLALDAATDQVLGCVNVSIMQPEALLPPPLPSSAPLRFYVSNMAVASSHRRQGLAQKLLDQCARIGQLWGWDSVWLHVSVLNTPAQALYQRAGFAVVNQGMPLAGPLRQILLCRGLPRRQPQTAGSDSGSLSIAASRIRSSSSDSSGSSSDGEGPGPGAAVEGVTGRLQGSGVYFWQAAVEGGGAGAGQERQARQPETSALQAGDRESL